MRIWSERKANPFQTEIKITFSLIGFALNFVGTERIKFRTHVKHCFIFTEYI